MLKIKNQKEVFVILFVFFFVFLCTYIISLPALRHLLIEDIWKLFTASQSEGAATLSYWIKIFTHPHHGGVQYRPFSFFVYPFVARHFFGLNLHYYFLVGVTLCSLNAVVLFKIMRVLTNGYIGPLVGVFVFLSHAVTSSIVSVPSFHVKYLLPLLLLMISLYLWMDSQGKKWKVVAILVCYLISLLCHEGSVTFPFILFLWKFILRRKFEKNDSIVFIPTVLYLLLRFFVFSIPNTGFMRVSILTFPENILFYINHLWNFSFIEYNSGILILSCLLCYLVFMIYRKRFNIAVASIISSFMVLAPFSLLSDHNLFDRCFWGVPFVAIFFSYFFSQKKMRTSIVQIVLMIMILFNLFNRKGFFLYSWSCLFDAKATVLEEFSAEIKRKVDSYPFIQSFEVRVDPLPIVWAERTVLAGILAALFPHKIFLLPKDERKGTMDIYILGGSYYYDKKGHWLDPFDVKTTGLVLPNKFHPLKINNALMK